VRRSVDALVERCKEDIESAKKACDEYAADERALDAKIKKKKNELEPAWKSTSVSGALDYRAVRNRHRHAIEQASRRWRGGRRDERTVNFDFHTGWSDTKKD